METHLYDDLDHIDLLAALALPLQDSQPVLSDIIEFLDYYMQQPEACKAVDPNRLNTPASLKKR